MLILILLAAAGYVCRCIHRANRKPSKPALRFDEIYVKQGLHEIEDYLRSH